MITGLDHLVPTVRDLDATARFHGEGLGMRLENVRRRPQGAALRRPEARPGTDADTCGHRLTALGGHLERPRHAKALTGQDAGSRIAARNRRQLRPTRVSLP